MKVVFKHHDIKMSESWNEYTHICDIDYENKSTNGFIKLGCFERCPTLDTELETCYKTDSKYFNITYIPIQRNNWERCIIVEDLRDIDKYFKKLHIIC